MWPARGHTRPHPHHLQSTGIWIWQQGQVRAWSRGPQARWPQPSPAGILQGAPAGGAPHATLPGGLGRCVFPPPAGPEDREKFAGAAGRLGPGISRAAPAPPQRVAMETVGSLVAENRPGAKAKYYECSWGDFRGAGDRRAGAGARGRSRQQKAECEEERGVCMGPPRRCVRAGPSCFPEAPWSLISLQQLHLFSTSCAPSHPSSPGSRPASLPTSRLGASWAVRQPPPRATGSPT